MKDDADRTGPFDNRPNANTEKFKRKAEDLGDDELAGLRLMLEDADLPFGRRFDGRAARRRC